MYATCTRCGRTTYTAPRRPCDKPTDAIHLEGPGKGTRNCT
ncbi:hypothetical protein [Kitasatospora sp. MBT66]|nr:hypothetical protein [Kitasatospora sp. MBT66]